MYSSTQLFLFIIDKFQTRIESMEENKVVMEFTFAEIKHLIFHHEELIAYENLCENLYEFDVLLEKEMYDDLIRLGVMLQADCRYREQLQELAQ